MGPAAEAGAEGLHLLHADVVGEALDRIQSAGEEFVVVVEGVGLVVPHVEAVCEGPELGDVGGRAVTGSGVARVEADDLDVAGGVKLGQLDVPFKHLIPGVGQVFGVEAGLVNDGLVVHEAVAGTSLEAGHAVCFALPLHRFEQAGDKVVAADDVAVVDAVVDGHDRAARVEFGILNAADADVGRCAAGDGGEQLVVHFGDVEAFDLDVAVLLVEGGGDALHGGHASGAAPLMPPGNRDSLFGWHFRFFGRGCRGRGRSAGRDGGAADTDRAPLQKAAPAECGIDIVGHGIHAPFRLKYD